LINPNGRDPNKIVIDLPLTGEEGMIENLEELIIQHEYTNYEIRKKIYGYRLKWDLSYDNYSHKSTMFKLYEMLKLTKNGLYRMFLTPRIDTTQRNFEVFYSGEELSFGVKGGGRNAIGQRLVNLSFTTKHLVEDWQLVDPDSIPRKIWCYPMIFIPKNV
jgi:hypothetical protein